MVNGTMHGRLFGHRLGFMLNMHSAGRSNCEAKSGEVSLQSCRPDTVSTQSNIAFLA